MAMVVHKASKVPSTSFPTLPESKTRTAVPSRPANNKATNRQQVSNSTHAWLKGGGPIHAPTTRNAAAGKSTLPSSKLPAVARVRSQTYDEATRRNVRSNPMPDDRHNNNHLRVPHRKSNSAPSPVAGRKNIIRPTNHDRKNGGARPALPKINNLVAGDGSAQHQHKLDGNTKRWASSWADARAHHEPSPRSTDTSETDGIRTSPRLSSQRSTSKSNQQQHSMQTSSKSNPRNTANSERTKSTSPSHQKGGSKLPRMSVSQHSSQDKTTESPNKKDNVIKRRNYGAKDQFIDSPITNAYSTSVVHVNSLRTGTFVDYEDVGETMHSRKTENPVKGRDRSGSQASIASTLRKGVAYRPTPKNKKPIMITKKTRKKERKVNSVYDNKTYKVQRKAWILKKMETSEKLKIDEYNQHLEETDKKFRESVVLQRQRLKQVRDNFDAEQVKRFKRQYVSWKSVETGRLNGTRETYGLPDNIYDDRYDRTLKEVTTKPTKGKKKFKQYASWVKNIKRFESMLNPSILGNPEVMKTQMAAIVEGIDTVELTNGDNKSAKKKKPVKVRAVIGSAKRLLSANDDDLDVSFRADNKKDTRRISMISGLSDLSLSDDDDEEEEDEDDDFWPL